MSEYKPNRPNSVIFSSALPEQWDTIIEALEGCKFYCYIFHENEPYVAADAEVLKGNHKVGEVKKKHLHVFVMDAPKSFKSWGRLFGIPDNQIQWLRAGIRANLLYLTHESRSAISAGKLKYERSLVVTNNRPKYINYISGPGDVDYHSELNDLLDYQSGHISLTEFLDRHPDILNVSPYQRLNVYKNLLTIKKY